MKRYYNNGTASLPNDSLSMKEEKSDQHVGLYEKWWVLVGG